MWTHNKKIVYREPNKSAAQLKISEAPYRDLSKSQLDLPKLGKGEVSKSMTRLPHTVYL
jgi:hypothetical protein